MCGGWVGEKLASIDPGPAIGQGLASVDKAVNQIPGGWITVGALAAGGAALAYAPEVMAYAAETGIAPEIASAELGLPAVDASTGAFINPATGLAWEATGSGLAGNGVQLTAAEFASQAGVGELTAKEILSNASRAKQLAQMISGGSAAKPSAQQFAQFQQANQPVQEQFGGLYKMNQNPFAKTEQPTSVQNPFGKTQDFLTQLAEESKTTPTLADLLRNA
jgi:hypothetical protein